MAYSLVNLTIFSLANRNPAFSIIFMTFPKFLIQSGFIIAKVLSFFYSNFYSVKRSAYPVIVNYLQKTMMTDPMKKLSIVRLS